MKSLVKNPGRLTIYPLGKLRPFIVPGVKLLVAAYIIQALCVSCDNQRRIPENTYISWSQMELVGVKRALSGDLCNVQIIDPTTGVLLSTQNVEFPCSGDNVAAILGSGANVSFELVASNKNLHDEDVHTELLERLPDKRAIFHFREGQIGEYHCPLYAIQSAIYAVSGGALTIDIETIGKELGFDFETKTGYRKVWKMADILRNSMYDQTCAVDRTLRPTLKRIDEVLSHGGAAVVNVLSQGGYMHRVTIVGEIDGKYIIINSGRTMFDEDKQWMKCISPFEPYANYLISTGTLQLLPKSALEFNITHSLEQNFGSGVLKELTFGTVYGAAIYVQKKDGNEH